ncbi:MAG: hypothetical protein JKY99_12075 [Rhizobiales bacterium]|nr:hypothetical protein [Hyphomicrobiales bacterium]
MAPQLSFSQDADFAKKIGDILVETMSKVSGDTITYESASFSDELNAVVLENVSLLRARAKRPSLIVQTTTIVEPEMMENGGFSAQEIKAENIKIQTRASSGMVASANASNVFVQPADQVAEGALSQWFKYDKSTIRNIQLGGTADAPVLTIEELDTIVSINDNNIPVKGDVSLNGLVVHMDRLSKTRVKNAFADLGYEQLKISLKAKGSYKPEDKLLSVEQFVLSGDDSGTLSIVADIGGIPESFMASPLDPRTIIATASIGKLLIDFQDHSITNRVLGLQAKKMGVEPEALAAQLSGALPFFLIALQNEAFQKQVAEAVTSYLSDPKSFAITVNPEKPTPFIQIFAALTSAPGTVVDLLGLNLTANQ